MTIANGTSLKPGTDLLPRSAGPTEPSGAASPRRGGFSSPPELGAEVTFRRSPSHHPETGYVRGRMYGSGAIEIVDMNAKPLRLEAHQYEHVPPMPTTTHGRQPSPVSPPPDAGEGIWAMPPHAGRSQRFLPGWWVLPSAMAGMAMWCALIMWVLR